MSEKIYYKKRKKYKYTLFRTVSYETHITGYRCHGLLSIDDKGVLTIGKGYAWDGVTGGIDTKTTMRAGLIHDALYQLMREGILPMECRKRADEILREVMLEEGAMKIRADYYYLIVRKFAKFAAMPDLLSA